MQSTVRIMYSSLMKNRMRQVAQKGCSSSDSSSSRCDSSYSGDDSVFNCPDYDEAATLTTGLCRDYVCYRLKRSGYDKQIVTLASLPATDLQLSNRILNLGCAFEGLYPKVYSSLSKQLGQHFFSEPDMRRLYYRLGTHILGADRRSFTWAKILSLFCVSGAMAVDCMTVENPELVECVIAIASDYMRQNVLDWVLQNGGWTALPDHFASKTGGKKHSSVFPFVLVPRKLLTHLLATLALTVASMIFLHDCKRIFF